MNKLSILAAFYFGIESMMFPIPYNDSTHLVQFNDDCVSGCVVQSFGDI